MRKFGLLILIFLMLLGSSAFGAITEDTGTLKLYTTITGTSELKIFDETNKVTTVAEFDNADAITSRNVEHEVVDGVYALGPWYATIKTNELKNFDLDLTVKSMVSDNPANTYEIKYIVASNDGTFSNITSTKAGVTETIYQHSNVNGGAGMKLIPVEFLVQIYTNTVFSANTYEDASEGYYEGTMTFNLISQ